MGKLTSAAKGWWGGRCPVCLSPLNGHRTCANCGASVPARYLYLRRSALPLVLLGVAMLLVAGAGTAAALGAFSSSAANSTPSALALATKKHAAPRTRIRTVTTVRREVRTVTVHTIVPPAIPRHTTAGTEGQASGGQSSGRRSATGQTTQPPSTPTATNAATKSATTTPPKPRSARVLPLDASTYAPGGQKASAFGSPALAVDNELLTAWTYTLNPATHGSVGAGLLMDVEPSSSATAKSLTILTSTPWMSVTVYGATGDAPATVTAPGWVPLATFKHISPTANVLLHGKPFDHFLVWVTQAAPGVDSGQIGINAVWMNLTVDGSG
jgi:hypothetical protein